MLRHNGCATALWLQDCLSVYWESSMRCGCAHPGVLLVDAEREAGREERPTEVRYEEVGCGGGHLVEADNGG